MNQKQMREFLSKVYETHKAGEDVKPVIAEYERKYKYVYFYNDFCAKYILTGDGKDLSLVTDLVNAALRLTGCDCISEARLENPVISGGPVYKDIEQDILLTVPRQVEAAGSNLPGDRIGLEIQHVNYDAFHNRLLFYVSRNFNNTLMKGDFYDKLPKVNVICFQMFDYLPWKISKRYVHTICYTDDEHNVFSDYQTLTIVEVNKFLEHSRTDYAQDRGRLAQWLRAIDALNNNADYSEFSNDANFLRLQSWAKLSIFVPEVFIQAGDHMDKREEEAAYIASQKARAEERQKAAAVIAAKDAELSTKAAEYASALADRDARIRELEEALAKTR